MFIKPIEFWQSILENCEEGQNMENVWKRFAKDYLSIVISELTFTAAIHRLYDAVLERMWENFHL